MSKKRLIIISIIVVLIVFIFEFVNNKELFVIDENVDASNANVLSADELKEEVLLNKEEYITVGAEDGEFKSIKEALEAVDSKRKTIYMLDSVHNECSIVINKDVKIVGFGPNDTIIQGADDVESSPSRIIVVEEGGKLEIVGLTVQHGRVYRYPRGGGGIWNKGNLIVDNCIIQNNKATLGVGIYNEGTLYMQNSTVRGNRSIPRPPEETRLAKGCGGSGAGIKVENGEATIINSTIVDNVANIAGGGIKVSCDGSLYLTNSTIAENNGGHYGGGIAINGYAKITHCTIVDNVGPRNGGIYVVGDLEFSANIIANNSAHDFFEDLSHPNNYPDILLNEYNFIGDGDYENFLSGEIELTQISHGDGRPMVYKLPEDSIAVNALPSDVNFVETDQRGLVRSDSYSDIGAYELHSENREESYYITIIVGAIMLIIIILYHLYERKGIYLTY